MQNMTDFETQYNDHVRQMAWVNNEAWQFDPPTRRKRMRVIVAAALVALATRLFSPAPESGESAAAPDADAGYPRNATIA
jgi:hypothetical protein